MTTSGRERNASRFGKAFVESLEGLGETGKSVIVSNLQRRSIFIDDVQISLRMLRDVDRITWGTGNGNSNGAYRQVV